MYTCTVLHIHFSSAILYRTVQLKSIIFLNFEYVFSFFTFHRAYVNYYNTVYAFRCAMQTMFHHLIICTTILYTKIFVVQYCCTTRNLLYNTVVSVTWPIVTKLKIYFQPASSTFINSTYSMHVFDYFD